MLVGGPAAELIDAKQSTRGRLPIALVVVMIPTALLLFVLTGSLLIPLKALVLNALTLLATLGVLVLLFAGVLLAVVLRGAADWLARHSPLTEGGRWPPSSSP